MNPAAPLVECRRLARTFGHGPTAVVAVHGLTCTINRGDLIALTGPSGSGKSTVVHLLAGIDEPTSGTIAWPALGDRNELRPRHVGVVFQGSSLMAALDVVQNVALPLLLGGSRHRDATARAVDAIEFLGLSSLAARLPEELSAGQAQRVAVARALVGHPDVILADEPTGQLDRAHAAAVTDALIAAASESGAALMVATHDDHVARRCPTRWTMIDGRLQGALACSA
jgi:ABC-type lipoprotein export system ATPase subunit